MARAYGVDTQLFVAGRDLLGGQGVTDLSLSFNDVVYEATAFRQAARTHDYSRELGEVPVGLTGWLDPSDTPSATARGLQERSIRGGATFRFWPGRGRGSLVAPDVNLTSRTYQFSRESPAKIEVAGRLNAAAPAGRHSGARGALSLEDGTLPGDGGTATLDARSVDLRGAVLRRVGAFRYDGPGGRLFFDAPVETINNHLAVAGDLVAFDDVTASATVTNLLRIVSVVYSDSRRADVVTCENAGAAANPWAPGSPGRTAYDAAGASGTWRVVKHAVSTSRPSHAGGAQVHALVAHVPAVEWGGGGSNADRLRIRPAYRDLTDDGARTAWDQTQAGAVIQASDLPWFGWLWFTGNQTAEVAFDWAFANSGGAALVAGANPRSVRVLADYAPIVAQL